MVLKYRRLSALLVLVGTALLSACGGGGGSSDSPAPAPQQFIDWSGSANGSIVLDSNGQQLQFREPDGVMVYQGNNYTNFVAVPSGALTLNGQPFGSVQLRAGASGTQVATLICQDGTTVGTLTGSGPSLNESCVSKSTTPTSSYSTQDAHACISLTYTNQSNGLQQANMSNTCGYPIAYTVCSSDRILGCDAASAAQIGAFGRITLFNNVSPGDMFQLAGCTLPGALFGSSSPTVGIVIPGTTTNWQGAGAYSCVITP